MTWGCRVPPPEPVLVEHLMDLLYVQALALGQHEVDEDGAQRAASSKEEESPVCISNDSDPTVSTNRYPADVAASLVLSQR